MDNNIKTDNKKLGIIQSRGIGDILIAIPIAGHYHQQGHEIYWPICEEFVSHIEHSVPWVNWVPVPTDPQGNFFYNTPTAYLTHLGVTDTICLYQSLTSHPEFSQRPEFQIMSFDQYKYSVAQVPFLDKWRLPEYITRNTERETQLFDQVTSGKPYVVTHLRGSNFNAQVEVRDWVPSDDWDIIDITERTDSVWDWLTVLERAEAIVTVDSVFANLVDQMGIAKTVDCYFVPRSHIQLTPVLGGNWSILDPDADTLARISIFRSG